MQSKRKKTFNWRENVFFKIKLFFRPKIYKIQNKYAIKKLLLSLFQKYFYF